MINLAAAPRQAQPSAKEEVIESFAFLGPKEFLVAAYDVEGEQAMINLYVSARHITLEEVLKADSSPPLPRPSTRTTSRRRTTPILLPHDPNSSPSSSFLRFFTDRMLSHSGLTLRLA